MDCELSSPSLSEISDNEIKSHIDCDSIFDWNIAFKQLPVHTQAVEPLVKFIMEAPGKVCLAESRDGFMKITVGPDHSCLVSPANPSSIYLQLQCRE